MDALKTTIDGLVEARHRLIKDSALEMNRMTQYMSCLRGDYQNFQILENILTSNFEFNFNNDNYIDSYMIDVTYNDNDIYSLIASNYDLFLAVTKQIKTLKITMFELFLYFWDRLTLNNANQSQKELASYIYKTCDSLLIIHSFIYNEHLSFGIPTDIINYIDKYYKSFSFQKCNPLMNFELLNNDNITLYHKFMYNSVVIIGNLFKSFRKEIFQIKLKIQKVNDTNFGIGFISSSFNWKLPICTGKNNNCMFLFGNGNYLSSSLFKVHCPPTKWNDDLSLFTSNEDSDKSIIISIYVNMRKQIATIWNNDDNTKKKWHIQLPDTIAVAIYFNDEYSTKSDRIHDNNKKKVISIIEQTFK